MSEAFLGISAFYHDSAAALLVDGEIVAAAQEERFSRKKYDPSFPRQAVRYVLQEGGLGPADLTAVAFYDKPLLKFERLLENYHAVAPRGLRSFVTAMPVWLKEKLFLRSLIRRELDTLGGGATARVLFPEHHLSHAASAFYPSPFEEAAVITVDGVGEWATTTIGVGRQTELTVLRQLDYPHSLGLLYSAFTYYCGFKVNSGEYKLMGLAPYGDVTSERVKRWKQLIADELVDLRPDGSLLLNLRYFDFTTGLRMCNDARWQKLFGLPPRAPESPLTAPYMDLALAIQEVCEEALLRLARTARALTGCDQLVLAGGVALNCVANGRLLREQVFRDIWVQPAAGDAGGALGAAYAAWHLSGHPRQRRTDGDDGMQGALLGPAFDARAIERMTGRRRAPCERFDDFDRLCRRVAEELAAGAVVGWFQGRMEFGPRALGNRSILGDARNPEMQKKLNLKIKFREGFRPFAPSVLEEDVADYFDLDRASPYMLLVAPVRTYRRRPLPENNNQLDLYPRLYLQRSDIPAVTHVDFSARIQSVSVRTNPRYWRLISAFKELTGTGVIVNTSFNVRGEPIVCTPDEAYLCFMRTEMDYLVLGDHLFIKTAQPPLTGDENWRVRYAQD